MYFFCHNLFQHSAKHFHCGRFLSLGNFFSNSCIILLLEAVSFQVFFIISISSFSLQYWHAGITELKRSVFIKDFVKFVARWKMFAETSKEVFIEVRLQRFAVLWVKPSNIVFTIFTMSFHCFSMLLIDWFFFGQTLFTICFHFVKYFF